MSQGDEYAAAMVEFLSCFPSISTPPTELSDLADGITMFEALSEMYVLHTNDNSSDEGT